MTSDTIPDQPKDAKETQQVKWRGIKTKSEAIDELEPVTTTNRLGQKSLHMPRIDDKKRWAGFPGLSGWARQIAKLIPKCDFYIEPFAGAAKVYQELIKRKDAKVGQCVLNDRSLFLYKWLENEFPKAIVTQEDFIRCIKGWDSKTTFYLIDAPWYKSFYDQVFSIFDRSSVGEYDEQIISLCTGIPVKIGDKEFNSEEYKIKGKFIITTRKENVRMLRTKFNHKLIKSEYIVSGHYPRLLLTTNLKLKKK